MFVLIEDASELLSAVERVTSSNSNAPLALKGVEQCASHIPDNPAPSKSFPLYNFIVLVLRLRVCVCCCQAVVCWCMRTLCPIRSYRASTCLSGQASNSLDYHNAFDATLPTRSMFCRSCSLTLGRASLRSSESDLQAYLIHL